MERIARLASLPTASALLFLAALPACTHGPLSSYQACLREHADHVGMSRRGFTTKGEGVWWADWGGGGIAPREPVLTLTMTHSECLYSVQVQGQGQGASWVQGDFTYLEEMRFHQDVSGQRIGFVGYTETASYAVIDGVRSPPYDEVVWPPWFSNNGKHAGYLARDATGGLAVVDGRVVGHAREYHRGMFEVLDDGRFAAAPKREDGNYEIVVGDVRSPPFSDLCDSRTPLVLPSGRYAAVGKRGARYFPIVNGREYDMPGIPANCEIRFSDDEQRWGYIAIHTGPEGIQSKEEGAVVDGQFYALASGTSGAEVLFVGRFAVVRTSKADPSGNSIHGNRKWENVRWLVDLLTPQVAPTEDDYYPVDNGSTVEWDRVEIGTSIGPRFDKVDLSSLEVDGEGHVHYTGERGSVRIAVVDNVIQPASGAGDWGLPPERKGSQ